MAMYEHEIIGYGHLYSPSRLFLTRKRLFDVIDNCKSENNWSALNSLLECVYSSKSNLSGSFLQGSDDDNSEDKSECEDTEKEFKCLPGVYYTLDIVSLRRAYERLFSLNDINFFPGIKSGLKQLATTLKRSNLNAALSQEKPYELMNALIVIFEIPYLGNMLRFEDVLPYVCQIVCAIPLSARAMLTEVLGKTMRIDSDDNEEKDENPGDQMPANNKLVKLHQTLQQQLTLRLLTTDYHSSSSYNLNLDTELTNTVVVLECVFYSSILAGKVDSVQILENERKYYKEHNLYKHSAIANSTSGSRDNLSSHLSIHSMDCRIPLIPYDEFINDTLNRNLDIEQDYVYFKANKEVSFMNYSFLLNTHVKTKHLFYENRMQMRPELATRPDTNNADDGYSDDDSDHYHDYRPAASMSLLQSPSSLSLSVDRRSLVAGTLDQLERIIDSNPDIVKRRLYIEFYGEETIDDGGVSKEFFQLITEQIFHPDYGMFVRNASQSMLWFNPLTIGCMGREFRLIGIVLGLAIYNNVILDLHFPPVLYRKLMGKLGGFEDLQALDPVMYSSLQNMLNCNSESELEDVYAQSFEISLQDSFGNVVSRELKEGGKHIPVTLDNKEEFVELYSDYILNESIKEHFNAFFVGFHMVVHQCPLKLLFRPDEIELILCGSKSFDFHELERSTKYDGGYDEGSRVIRDFWWLVQREMSVEEHSKLLKFATGSDRIPIGGMQNMNFVILRSGPDSDKLPTAHTCYNTLLLPEYRSRIKMQRLLLKAINYSIGFGIL